MDGQGLNKTLIADILICNANKSVIYMRNWNVGPKLNWILKQTGMGGLIGNWITACTFII